MIRNLYIILIYFFSVNICTAQTYFLPDTNFVKSLKTKYPSVIKNDSLLIDQAKKITGWVDFQSQNLHNIDGIQFFTNVSQLNLAKNKLKSTPNLDSLTTMNQLYINENELTELPRMSKSVQNIFAFSNKLTSIENITNLTNLTFLHVSNNQLVTLPHLKYFPNLDQLHCNQNKIVSIEGLETLTKAKNLYLWENQLTQIDGLAFNTTLKVLYINNNNLENLPNLKNKPNLSELSLSMNYFTFSDLYPLFELDSAKNFSYAPMKNLDIRNKITAYENKEVIFKSTIDTSLSDLVYSLYKNDSIFLSENTSGMFKITSNNYAENDSFTIKIKSPKATKITVNHEHWLLKTANCKETKAPHVSITNNDCSKGASVKLITTESLVGFDTLNYSLSSKDTDLEYILDSTFSLDNVKQGVYYFRTKTESTCETANLILIPNAPNCDQIFSPNNDGVKDQFYFDKIGEVKIYDLKGVCIQTLTTPATWDGKDKNGILVPFGYYSVIYNDSEVSHITVIK